MKTAASFLAVIACAVAPAFAGTNPVGYSIASINSVNLVSNGTYGGSLSTLNVTGAYGKEAPVYLLQLRGSRFQMGYDYGQLFGLQSKAVYTSLLRSILGDSWVEPVEQALLSDFMDMQWNDYLSAQVPPRYIQELEGATAGGIAAGVEDVQVGTILTRALTLANLPGSLTDLVYVLEDEAQHPNKTASMLRLEATLAASPYSSLAEYAKHLEARWRPLSCSMIGMWGSRTQGGALYTGRNLDWESDTGINAYKAVVVFRPNDGAAPHATMGFGGLIGALTGISSKGLTVHEANLEEKPETFRGFPWMLRLRYVMEEASDLATALDLWRETNNTAGFNFGIGSAADKEFVVMETNAKRTAFFHAMDPREGNATYTPKGGGSPVQIGFPLPDAVWRTNNPFDPGMRENFLWSQGPGTNSQNRYQIIHDSILDVQATGVPATPDDMINITAVVGQKGSNYFKCGPLPHTGSNVLSVAYDPASLRAWSAWEAGSQGTWTPAACSTYIALDFSQWF